MWNIFIKAQLEAFWIDEDELHFVGSRAVENRNDQRVYADRLARAGRAGNQQVRHLCKICNVVETIDRFAERDREF